ncbi:unnamed protein product [Paramecium pentaurelia]|uniref:Uncharacterized protein n=1 Tax=Paramecium pentaurelia TaxID=43138 RepID=A0A8S1XQF8_9CILI|nr:unnamed protein product [Paramecium pentaurelia]
MKGNPIKILTFKNKLKIIAKYLKMILNIQRSFVNIRIQSKIQKPYNRV